MSSERQQGRGRLNSIELLPDEAEPDIVWAMQMLRERSMPQIKILAEFNARLADRGIGPISAGAFSRHSVRIAAFGRRMERVREAAAVMTERLEPGQTDDLTIHATEMVKMLIVEMGENADLDETTPTQVKAMAEALRAAEAAQNTSAERRRKLEAEMAAKMKLAEKEIDAVGREKGLTRDTVEAIKARVLGVKPRTPPPAEPPHVP